MSRSRLALALAAILALGAIPAGAAPGRDAARGVLTFEDSFLARAWQLLRDRAGSLFALDEAPPPPAPPPPPPPAGPNDVGATIDPDGLPAPR